MSFPRIDSHQHFTREYLPSLLFPILKRNRFDGTVVVAQLSSVEESCWLLNLAAEHEFIRAVVCGADLAGERVGDVLDEYQRHPKFRGVCWYPAPNEQRPGAPNEPRPGAPNEPGPGAPNEPRPSGSVRESDLETLAPQEVLRSLPDGRGSLGLAEAGGVSWRSLPDGRGSLGCNAEAGLAELARRDLTLDLPPHFELVSRIAAQFPTLRIAVDHVGRPSLMECAQPDRLAELARHPNVFVKISGLITDAPTGWKAAQFTPWVRAALTAFSARRVMFGSDWPSYLPVGTWKEALAAFTQALGPQTMETREHLLGATAQRFYRLGDDA